MGMMEKEEQSTTGWERWKIKIITRGMDGRSLWVLTSQRVYTQLLSSLPWVVMPQMHESGPFQVSATSYGQPRETTEHLLGPI